METHKMALVVILTSCISYACIASPCLSENDCLDFEYCCKGNCTSKRLRCEHICQSDHDCQSESRCLLGLCVNCTSDLPCQRKQCLNDSHCPGGHSCENKLCEVKKQSNLTAEMAPFLIFIAALSLSLLIVCYNDYIVERFGQQGWRERLGCMYCNCTLTLWFWMWRFRRSRRQQADDSSCPAVEVQFDSRASHPPNPLNEKPNSQTSWYLRSLKRILFFWRRNNEFLVRECLPLEGNNSEESTRNVEGLSSENSVILHNQFMNNNSFVTDSSPSTHHSSYLREQRLPQDYQYIRSDHDPSENIINCVPNEQESSWLDIHRIISRLNDDESAVNNYDAASSETCSREVTTV